MKPINTIQIENFVDKVRIAKRTNKKVIELDIDTASSLSDTLVRLMIRLGGASLDHDQSQKNTESISITADGGNF
jgi:hypothetical protein